MKFLKTKASDWAFGWRAGEAGPPHHDLKAIDQL